MVGTSEAGPSDGSSGPHHLDLLLMTLVCPESPSHYQSPAWSFKSNILCWPFKRAPGFLADSLLFQIESILADFHCQVLCRLFFSSPGAWGLDPMLLKGKFCSRISSSFSAITHGCRAQPSPHLHPSYQPLCGLFCKSLIIILLSICLSIGYSGWYSITYL